MKNNPLFRYSLITYLASWTLWFFLMELVNHGVTAYGKPFFMTLYLLGGIFPSFAAFIVVRKDKDTYRRLKAEIFKFKAGIFWYIAIFLLPLAISGLSWIINGFLQKQSGPFLREPVYMVVGMLPIMIIGGGSEEIGWRGLVLPKLLEKMSPLKATLILSLVWGIWHIPLWFIRDVPQYGTNFLEFMVGTISLSFLLTILYLATRSVFLCILSHALENAYLNIGLDSWISGPISGWLNALGGLGISIILFWIYIHHNECLTRHLNNEFGKKKDPPQTISGEEI